MYYPNLKKDKDIDKSEVELITSLYISWDEIALDEMTQGTGHYRDCLDKLVSMAGYFDGKNYSNKLSDYSNKFKLGDEGYLEPQEIMIRNQVNGLYSSWRIELYDPVNITYNKISILKDFNINDWLLNCPLMDNNNIVVRGYETLATLKDGDRSSNNIIFSSGNTCISSLPFCSDLRNAAHCFMLNPSNCFLETLVELPILSTIIYYNLDYVFAYPNEITRDRDVYQQTNYTSIPNIPSYIRQFRYTPEFKDLYINTTSDYNSFYLLSLAIVKGGISWIS